MDQLKISGTDSEINQGSSQTQVYEARSYTTNSYMASLKFKMKVVASCT